MIVPGLYPDMPTETYFADPCEQPSLTQSIAKILIEQTPAHARRAHPRLSQQEEPEREAYSAAKAIGNAAHALMLGRGKAIEEIDAENFTTKDAKAKRDAAVAAKREPVLTKHIAVASAMVNAAREQLLHIPDCERVFDLARGRSEVVAIAQDDGLWLRTMLDFVTGDLTLVVDYKTSGMSASPYATGRLMASAGWHIQAAMHERILDLLEPGSAGRRRYLYVVQENDAPYALTVNEISESALTIGRKQVQYAIDAWRRCTETGIWPAYPLRIIRPELPAWFENGWLNREIEEADEPDYAEISRRIPLQQVLLAG